MAIQFKKITYKNFLSAGNSPIEIDLTTHKKNLIIGKNGHGKCVDPLTEIYVYDSVYDNYYGTTILNVHQIYQSPDNIGRLSVLTRFGYRKIEACAITAKNSQVIEITTSDGSSLKTSPDHLMLSVGDEWVKTKDLRIGSTLYNEEGEVRVTSLKLLGERKDLYDIQVAEVQEYYANGLVSHNSSILDSICFALFGKPHRSINKSQLINSVNGKQLYVEVEFDIGTIQYKVCRGIKPNIFDIYQNGQKLNKDADVRDYQKVLEQQILKLNYKSFTQVEILGSTSFTPFMKLTPAQRREVIEDVLDTGIFSVMNQINKEKISSFKDEVKNLDYKINHLVSAIDSQQKIIKSLSETRNNFEQEISDKIIKANIELTKLTDDLLSITEEISTLQEKTTSSDKISSLIEECKRRLMTKEVENDSIAKQLLFFENNGECPSCQQNIPHEHRDSVIETLGKSVDKNTSIISQIKVKFSELQERNREISEINKEIQSKNIMASSIRGSIKSTREYISEMEMEKNKFSQTETGNIEAEEEKRNEYVREAKAVKAQKEIVSDQLRLAEISLAILKDSGIKSTIIREYLPIINSTINKYLEKMDFFVNFELDENFNEIIKSRHRDEFSYASFSEGEKQRLDIAILLAWRHIAKLKNSINTNILFMDETLNGNLDDQSIESLLDIIDDISRDTNIFLITHNVDAFINRFDRVIKYEKQGNFSVKKEF